MPPERRDDSDIRERLVSVEDGITNTCKTVDRIELMLAKHIELDVPLRDAITLNTHHRESTGKMILGIWVSILGIIGTWISTHLKG